MTVAELRVAAREDLIDRLDFWLGQLPPECPDRYYYLRARYALAESVRYMPRAED